MTSLSEVYERKRGGGGHASPRRVVLGMALFVLGAVMIVVGLILASTEILSTIGIGRYESRRIAGVLAGLGMPAVFVGILSVLPASRRVRIAAGIGAGIAIVGVALFAVVYPYQWLGASVDRHYTFETAAIYFLGTLVTFWCFFVAVANFKTRNDPGGTVELEVLTAGETRVVEVDRSALSGGLGGIGLFGSGRTSDRTATVSDGGSSTQTISSPMDTAPAMGDEGVDVIHDTEEPAAPVDRYCGNCRHFDYVRERNGMEPYCGYHRETMDDMEACADWTQAQGE